MGAGRQPLRQQTSLWKGFLQTQMRLIEQMGIENYVQLQTKPNESGS